VFLAVGHKGNVPGEREALFERYQLELIGGRRSPNDAPFHIRKTAPIEGVGSPPSLQLDARMFHGSAAIIQDAHLEQCPRLELDEQGRVRCANLHGQTLRRKPSKLTVT